MESMDVSFLEHLQEEGEEEPHAPRDSKESTMTKSRKRTRDSSASGVSSEEGLGVNATNEQRLRARVRKAHTDMEDMKRKFCEHEKKLRQKVKVCIRLSSYFTSLLNKQLLILADA
jgi:hypothetical protein